MYFAVCGPPDRRIDMEKFLIGATCGMLAGALIVANSYKARTLIKNGQQEFMKKAESMMDEKISAMKQNSMSESEEE